MPITLTEENFEQEVLKSEGAVLVDFWAPWCMPCKMLLPTIEALSKELEGKAKVGKVNTDENRNLSQKYGIMTIPTVFIFKNGEIVEQFSGVKAKDDYIEALNKYL